MNTNIQNDEFFKKLLNQAGRIETSYDFTDNFFMSLSELDLIRYKKSFEYIPIISRKFWYIISAFITLFLGFLILIIKSSPNNIAPSTQTQIIE